MAVKSHSIKLPKLHLRHDLHLARKCWHMGMGLFMVTLYLSGMERLVAGKLLGVFLFLFLVFEFARLRFPHLNEKIVRWWGPLMRTSEINKISGTPYYIASSLITVLIFPKPIAALSIALLAVGDPLASLFGILYGKHSVRFANGKSLIGTLAGMIACFVVALLFFNEMKSELHLNFNQLLGLSVIAGMAGGGAEILPIEGDDNLAIPIVAGFAVWLGFLVLGI